MVDLSVSEISELLASDAEAIARAMLPAGHYDCGKAEWKASGRNSPTGDTISVHIRPGHKQGVVGFWNGARRGGDLLDLIEVTQGFDKFGAVQWAKQWLGIADLGVTTPSISDKQRREIAERRHRRDEREAEDRLRRMQTAAGVWDSTVPLSGPAAEYLRSRGINPSFAASDELRMHTGLPHPEGGSFPCLVARVTGPDGDTTGVWRTFLKADGSGKAPVTAPKLGLGIVKGGAVRIGGIWHEIGLTEGVETALAVTQIIAETGPTTGPLRRSIPVWAALSASGIRDIELPPDITRVRVFADADPMKFRKGQIKPSVGLEAAHALRERLTRATVIIHNPPVGMDWLDVLQKQGRAGFAV
jgi:hypothetical protein